MVKKVSYWLITKNSNHQGRNPADPTLTKWSWSQPSISTSPTPGVLYSDGGIISVVFLPQMHNHSLNLRIKDQPKLQGITMWHSGTESACQCWRFRFHPWVGKIPWWGITLQWGATHSSVLAWKIPWTGAFGGLQSHG